MKYIVNFFKSCFSIIKKEKIEREIKREIKYEVIAHEENFQNTGFIYVKIRVKGTRTIFCKAVSDIYKREWLDYMSGEDGAFIAILSVSEQKKDKSLIKFFPRKKQLITKNVILIGMMFVSFLILSNLTAFKIVEFNLLNLSYINFPAALVFFPLTYFFDNNLTEVYGFKISRFIIWSGLICSALVSTGIWLTVQLHPSHFWHYQREYETVLNSTPWLFFCVISGLFCW